MIEVLAVIYLYVGIGGIVGSLLRYLVGNLAGNIWNHGFPLSTLLINLSGAFILGWVTNRLVNLKKLHPHIFIGVSTGIVGSYTTFSTLSVETVNLLEGQEFAYAFFYILCSLAGGLLMVRLGANLGNKQFTRAGNQL